MINWVNSQGLNISNLKYRALLAVLRVLVYLKRGLWWAGARAGFVSAIFFGPVWRLMMWANYKINYLLKRAGFSGQGSWVFQRGNLQLVVFVVLFFLTVPQTKLQAKKDVSLYGQKTIAYSIFSNEEELGSEEVSAQSEGANFETPAWRQGTLSNDFSSGLAGDAIVRDQELAGLTAGGTVLDKPTIMPGAVMSGKRLAPVNYEIQPGDSLSSIAYRYGVSVATVMWENNLSLRSVLKLGQKLTILPITGVMHTVKKGDTIKKIASTYDAKEAEIVAFNKLNEDGTGLKIGERIMVPDGVQPAARALATTSRGSGTVSRQVAPAGSRQAPGVGGFIWPSSAKTITQYYTWSHHAIDIAGPRRSSNYAAKAGKVIISQCGWNSGYGCYVVIDHGGGVRTLYGHNDVLLVSSGDQVEAGQTIGLMGNTGKVRGVTGIHLHFEIQINGVRVNPLGYVR